MLSTAAFMALIGPSAFCALWPVKQLGNPPSTRVIAIPLGYGEWSERIAGHAADLNALGYGIYFTPNDPGGEDRHEKNFTSLRCIYRECDTSADPCQLSSELPHLHWITSPGKSQSLWLTEDLPADRMSRIHGQMVNLYGHDASSAGAGRLLRLPGFPNTKYPDKPLVTVTLHTETPGAGLPVARLPAARVLKTLGCEPRPEGVQPAHPNLHRFAQSAFSSDAGGSSIASMRVVEGPHARRLARSPELEDERAGPRAGTLHSFDPDTLVAWLALIPADERHVWFRVGASLHFMFDGADDGLCMWREWSRTSISYKSGDCDKEWRGFRSDRDGPRSSKVTLRHLASQYRPDGATQARKAAVAGARALLDNRITIQTLAAEWPDTRPAKDDNTRLETIGKSVANARYAIEALTVDLHWDVFAGEARTASGPWDDAQENALYIAGVELGLPWSRDWCRDTVQDYARERKRHPLLDYLTARRGTWDGKPRLETFLIRHLGSPDTRVNREMTVLLFVAMVRRAFEPGAKFDYLTILKGEQNLGKSSLFRRIMPDVEWFSDAPDLNEDAKRFYPALQGKLIIEFAELSGKSKGDIERIKKIVTQQRDEYTAMYGRHMTRSPRMSVFIGTTNEDVFLRDATGNRRFPVIECTRAFDARKVDAERDQIWAEAVQMDELYRQCDAYLELSDASAADMERIQAAHIDLDPGIQDVLDQLEALGCGRIGNDTLYEALGHGNTDRKSRHGGRVGAIMKNLKSLLKREGWVVMPKTARIAGKVQRGLVKLDADGNALDITCNMQGGELVHIPA
jgi:Virulence-associated protein E/Primase C terminal 2 (PriCT-2)/RepB DNA-primase from phage plasmid